MKNLCNRVQLIGNLGAEPAVREFESGKVKVELSIATNETYMNDKGEFITETQWHRAIAWGKLGKLIVKKLGKGDLACVTGKLRYHNYEDSEGIRRFKTDILLTDFFACKQKAAVLAA